MQILIFDRLNSTHLFLLNWKRKNTLIIAKTQDNGVGSRGNRWLSPKGNLYFSFSIGVDKLPKDINLASVSIYFGFLMFKILKKFNKKVKFKWPNDFYLEKKCGGVMSAKIKDILVVSMGINTKVKIDGFSFLDLKISNLDLIKSFLNFIDTLPPWQEIFKEFSVEFQKNKELFDLKKAKLLEDGSIFIDGKRYFSLR